MGLNLYSAALARGSLKRKAGASWRRAEFTELEAVFSII